MNDHEKKIRNLEEIIPTLAEGAVKQAYLHALLSGLSVLVTEDGAIVEIFPDGTKKVIKKLSEPIPIKKGLRIELMSCILIVLIFSITQVTKKLGLLKLQMVKNLR